MERLSQPRLRQTFSRLKRLAGFVVNKFDTTVEPYVSSHYKPSHQRDVSRTARQAAGVQLVIAPVQEYGQLLRFEPEHPDMPDGAA